jgi:gas vesicle protein
MNERMKSLLVGLVLGAIVGALFGWIVGESSENRQPGERTGLQAISTGDYIKIGVAVLTLAREFGQMMRKA